jgi:integrase
VILQVWLNGKVYRKTICAVLEKYWDARNEQVKPSHRQHAVLNKLIITKRSEAEKRYVDAQIENMPVPADVLSRAGNETMLLKAIDIFVNDALNGGTQIGRASFRAKMGRFLNEKDISINAVDDRFLREFRTHLETKERNARCGMGNSPNTVGKAYAYLSAVLNRENAKYNPVGRNRTRKPTEKVLKRKLENSEIILFMQAPVHTPLEETVRDLFSLSILLRGMRIADMLQLRCDQFKDGTLEYKTGKDKETHLIRLNAKAKEIVAKYQGEGRELLFPFFTWKPDRKLTDIENEINRINRIKGATSLVNNYLKKITKRLGITKKITTHIARHSFASLADKSGASLTDIQKLLGHSSASITSGYLSDIRIADELDEVADNILESIEAH